MFNNNEWIKNLKVGDKVVVYTNNSGKSITKVSKITPKGFINVESGKTFNPDGSERGGSTWNFSSLNQLTDEVVLEFKKKKLVNQCREIRFEELNIDQLQSILDITKNIVP